jgi:hypothetical protein
MKCQNCDNEIGKWGKKFCSNSCSAEVNNSLRNKMSKNCQTCDTIFYAHPHEAPRRKYCSYKCSAVGRSNDIWEPIKQLIIENKGLPGNIVTQSSYLKRFLIETHGPVCVRCEWSKKNEFTNSIPIEIDHIDGDSSNNKLSNVRLLCPNCHSLTATYKGANIGSNKKSARYEIWKKSFKD